MKTAKLAHGQDLHLVVDELCHLLADTYVLSLKTQNFHWNVRGPHFHSFHALFEAQYTELAVAVDEIAERIRALHAVTPASFAHFSKLTSLKEEQGAPKALEMVRQLAHDHDTIVSHLQSMIAKAEQANDEGTVDLLIQRQRAHQKAAWMLHSSLEN